MTAKNRGKNNSVSNDKSVAGQLHDDVAKKSPKVVKAENATVPSPAAGPGAPMKFLSAFLYVALAAVAVCASLYLQQELSDIRHASSRHEESVKKCSAAAREVERALQQINSMKASLEGLESKVVGTKADLESTSRAVQTGEANNRQMEATLQKLQSKIFQDLTEGIQEVKDAREKDISSLERTLEERLAQLSHSIAESVAEFAGEQSRYRSELSELKAHLEEEDTPELLKQELMSISSAVANLNTANEVAEGNMAVLREQIASVGAELQTRNREVASVSEEVAAVRTLMQSAVGSLREELSAARSGAQTATDQVQSLNNRQDQFSGAFQSLETQLTEQLLRAETRAGDAEARMKVAEESQEMLASLLSEQTNKLNALVSRYESHERSLDSHTTAVEKERQVLREDVEEARRSLGQLKEVAATLDRTQRRLEAVEEKLEAILKAGGSTDRQG